ncbi:IS30 family transposase [Halomonas icarae]|uniref:IS30 family transposase n=1 Tax=Halomonas icarae TaxID=2691040 RepID=UPI0035B5337C
MTQGHKQSDLVTLVERSSGYRSSGYLLAARLPKVSAELTQAAMIRLLKPCWGAVKTVTLDNGSEFAGHIAVGKAVTAETYFCDLYCSGKCGSNENTNVLIRQYFPWGRTSGRSPMPSCTRWSRSSMIALECVSVTGHRHKCSCGSTQEPRTQQVLHLLFEFRVMS